MDTPYHRASGVPEEMQNQGCKTAEIYGKRSDGSMTQEEYRAAMGDVVYLVSCAVNGIKPAEERISVMDLSRIYTAAQYHSLIAAVGMALQSAGIRDEQFAQAIAKAQRKNALLDADRTALFHRLEQKNIWYMPLKGSVLKDFYPQYGMRQMADIDILVDADRAKDVKAIMENLGFTTESFGRGNHDVYHKSPVSNFEIHTALFRPSHEKKIYTYYQDVKSRLIKDEGNRCGWHFSPEDFYVYMTAHEYKHFSGGGTGLRSVLDTYVYLKEKGEALDWAYIAREVEKLGISDFEAQNRSLALCLFGREKLTEQDEEMLEYILFSGTYGTVEHGISNKVEKLGGGLRGRAKYLLSRIFLPMESIKSVYPFFYKYKLLLPVLFFYRIGKGLTIRRRKVIGELKILTKRSRFLG